MAQSKLLPINPKMRARSGLANDPRGQSHSQIAAANTSNPEKFAASLEARANKALDEGDDELFKMLFEKALQYRTAVLASAANHHSKASSSQEPLQKTDIPIKKVSDGIKDKALDFKKLSEEELAETDDRKVYHWPQELKCDINFDELFKWMIKRTKTIATRKTYIGSVKNFFGVFKINDPSAPLLDIFKSLYDEGLIAEALDLEIWDADINWTTKMAKAMKLCMGFLGSKANRKGDTKGAQSVATFRTEFLDELKPLLATGRKEQHERRKR